MGRHDRVGAVQAGVQGEGETGRCPGVLARVVQIVEESLSQGRSSPAQTYSEVLTWVCSSLELDTSRMTGIETAMSDLVGSQAESWSVEMGTPWTLTE